MKLYHESLIPKLCDPHLLGMWDQGWEIFELLKNQSNPVIYKRDYIEFANCPLELAFRLHLIRTEMIKRGYHPHKTITPFDVCDTPLTQFFKELNNYHPWADIDQQKKHLREKGCECRV